MEASDISKQKKELRAQLKVSSLNYLAANKNAHSKVIHFLKEILPPNQWIGSFRSLQDEVSVDELLGSSYRLAFPRIEEDSLKFYAPYTSTDFISNSLNIAEPDKAKAEPVDLGQISVLLIPGLAFDRYAHRLGRGKGLYDRLLKDFNGLKIGVCTQAQICNAPLPVEDHDVVMDMVVTDEFVLRRFDA